MATGAQMHLDALRLRVIPCHVLEPPQVEIAIQFAVNAPQQVEVEGCGHARRIVIRLEQLLHRLHQIRAQKQRVAWLQARAYRGEETGRSLRLEVADGATEEQHQQS